jgi:hypothetical protein
MMTSYDGITSFYRQQQRLITVNVKGFLAGLQPRGLEACRALAEQQDCVGLPLAPPFDEWTSPFPAGSSLPSLQVVREKLADKIGVLEIPSLSGLAFLVLTGLALNKFDSRRRAEAFLMQHPPPSDLPVSVWNKPVPGPVLGIVALGALVVFSVVALYIYFTTPPRARRSP